MHNFNVLSAANLPPPQTKFLPYNDGQNGSGDNLYSPFEKNTSPPNPGFTLLSGHIKLMAMVPNLPENKVSAKPWKSPSNVSVNQSPSFHSLPPITPRMMPSIVRRYGGRTPLAHLSPSASHQRMEMESMPPSGNYYPYSHPYFNQQQQLPPSWQSQMNQVKPVPSFHRIPQQHQSLSMMPSPPYHHAPPHAVEEYHQKLMSHYSYEPTSSEFHYGSYNNPYLDPNWPQNPINYPTKNYSQQGFEFPLVSQYQYETPQHFHAQGRPNHPHLQYPASHQLLQPERGSLAQAPYSLLQRHMFPYAAQSAPCLLGPPAPQEIGMHPYYSLPQNCSSLPILNQRPKRTSRKSKKVKAPTSRDSSGKDVFIVVEEEDVSSSSSSLSSSEEYEIRKKASVAIQPGKEQENVPTAAPAPASVPVVNETAELEKAQAEYDKRKEETHQLTTADKTGKKDKSPVMVVNVHNCFMSDSSEAELDPDVNVKQQSSDVDSRRSAKRKACIPAKHIKLSGPGGMKGEIFEGIENDLNPDEVRTYTCDYLVELLNSQNSWNDCYLGLQIVVRLARHRPRMLLNHLNDNSLILWCTFGHITSPKSALCRAAIVTFKELFQEIPDSLDKYLDRITEKLVLKSLAPNRFIRVECDRALTAMVKHCNLVKILSALEIVRKKPQIRASGLKLALARMCLQVVQTAGVDLCLTNPSYADKLLPMLFCFMMEPDNDIRYF